MKIWSSRLILAVAAAAIAWAQTPAPKTQTAGEAFKNVTTSTLKGLTVSDFLGAMGVMSAALGYDCGFASDGCGNLGIGRHESGTRRATPWIC